MSSTPRGNFPISQAFDASDLSANPFLYRAVELIEQVHACGPLPTVIFKHAPSASELEYRPAFPPQIVIDSAGRHKLPMMIHCIGHLIDQFGLGSGGYDSFESRKLRGAKYSGPLSDWWVAVHGTETVRTLYFAMDDPPRLKSSIKGTEIIPEKMDLAYLVSAEELWARSYLQYITVKTNDPVLVAFLKATLDQRAFTLFEQWPAREFTAIEVQIDALFARLGWRQG